MRYEQSTEGIRVRVEPTYSLAESKPADRTFVFSYHIEMANEGETAARLLFRNWRIHDSVGEDTDVEGEGVVGKQPHLQPGCAHRYESFCVLKSATGYMEGYYTFERPSGQRFRVNVPRFHLSGPLLSSPDEGRHGVMH